MNFPIIAKTTKLLLIVLPCSGLSLFSSSLTFPDYLQPGSTYREYTIRLRENNIWRVTDPKAPHKGAQEFLPNRSIDLAVDSIKDVQKASIMISHWLGHAGTTGQVFFFNDAPAFNIPLNANYPASHRDRYYNLDNLSFDLPLEFLKEGVNTFRGSLLEEEQGKHWWGQWGWYLITLRTFFEPCHSQTSLKFLNLENSDTFNDNPTLKMEIISEHGVDRIEVFARYYDYDENGDYLFTDWHGFFHDLDSPEGHVGTIINDGDTDSKRTVHELEWDTEWIPDQQPGGIALIARMRDKEGNWSVGEVVKGLTLKREHRTVKLITAENFPTKLIRNGAREVIKFRTSKLDPMAEASRAVMKIRTWNGTNNERGYTPFVLNGSDINEQLVGKNHYYGLDTIHIDPAILVDGENSMEIFSETHHHGCEVLVPGPAIFVEWIRDADDAE